MLMIVDLRKLVINKHRIFYMVRQCAANFSLSKNRFIYIYIYLYIEAEPLSLTITFAEFVLAKD